MTPIKLQAIQTALSGDWENAIVLNRTLLEDNPKDIDTLNRLAYALSSAGNTKEAKAIYQQVLTLDTQNPIALRNLKRLSGNSLKKTASASLPQRVNNTFIEEPGKTKVIELINVAEQKIISQLRSGEYVQLCVKRMKIFVLDYQKQYIGMLPDDIGRRLVRFIDGGNQYEAYVKTIDKHRATIFVKEIKRAIKFKHQPSFVYPAEKLKFTLDTSNTSTHRHAKDVQKNQRIDVIEEESKDTSQEETDESL